MERLRQFTPEEIEQAEIEVMRGMTPTEKWLVIKWLTYVERSQIYKSVRDAHPGVTGNELGLLFIAACYGQELADRLRTYIHERQEAGFQVKLGRGDE